MEKTLKYMIIKYSDKDLEYIDFLFEKLDNISEEIVSFFNIKNFGEKVCVTLNDSLETFRKKYVETGFPLEKDGTVSKWTCGYSFKNSVETLCLSEYKKTKFHEKHSLDDLLYLILHEFTHACHEKIRNQYGSCKWMSEGLATTISHQYDNNNSKTFNATLDEMINSFIDYRNYHTMFKYVLDNYGRDYILKLIKDYDLLVKETPRLYDEIKEKYDSKKRK